MKKGFFFSIDAFLALMLFTLILVFIYSFFLNMGSLQQQYYFSEDLFDVLNNVELSELEDYDSITQLNYIIDYNRTIMEQVVTFTINVTNKDNATLLLTDIIGNLTGQYGIGVDVESLIFERGGNATNVVVRQRIVSGEESL
ncbi:MAG: hypothetical protein KJ674_01210 [Nanoarchaeota archaeon]|nr:hypothetical protein [Nanoarchaeota archaeon]